MCSTLSRDTTIFWVSIILRNNLTLKPMPEVSLQPPAMLLFFSCFSLSLIPESPAHESDEIYSNEVYRAVKLN